MSKLIVKGKQLTPKEKGVKLDPELLKEHNGKFVYDNLKDEFKELLFDKYEYSGVTFYLDGESKVTDPIVNNKDAEAQQPLTLVFIDAKSDNDTFMFRDDGRFFRPHKGIQLFRRTVSKSTFFLRTVLWLINPVKEDGVMIGGSLENVSLLSFQLKLKSDNKVNFKSFFALKGGLCAYSKEIYTYDRYESDVIINNTLMKESNITCDVGVGSLLKFINLRITKCELDLKGRTIIQNNHLQGLNITVPEGIEALNRFDFDVVSVRPTSCKSVGFVVIRSSMYWKAILIPVTIYDNASIATTSYDPDYDHWINDTNIGIYLNPYKGHSPKLVNVEDLSEGETEEYINKTVDSLLLDNEDILTGDHTKEVLVKSVLSRLTTLGKIIEVKRVASLVTEINRYTDDEFPF